MKVWFALLPLFFTLPVQASLDVVTSTTDLRAIAEEVGKGLISVTSIAKGTQDPHYIEAKPSFMTKLSHADLLIAVGLDLEVGWLPSVVRGSRNPRLRPGEKGYLEVGPGVSPLEVARGKVTRAEGDIHPSGNPHVTLDPIRAGEIARAVARKLAELDPPNAGQYEKNAKEFQDRLVEKTKSWQDRIVRSGVKKTVTYHRTLSYFLDRFKIEGVAILEPKPGIPPTSGHILEVIGIIRAQNVPLILVENYFESTVIQKIQKELPKVRSVSVPVAVEGTSAVKSLEDLYETLVLAVEGKSGPKR